MSLRGSTAASMDEHLRAAAVAWPSEKPQRIKSASETQPLMQIPVRQPVTSSQIHIHTWDFMCAPPIMTRCFMDVFFIAASRASKSDKLLGRHAICYSLTGHIFTASLGLSQCLANDLDSNWFQQKHRSTSPMAPVVAFRGKTGWPEAGALTGFSMMYCTAAWQVLEKKGVVEKVCQPGAVLTLTVTSP